MLPPSRGPDAPGGGLLQRIRRRAQAERREEEQPAAVESVRWRNRLARRRSAASCRLATSAASPAGEPAWAKRIKRSQSVATASRSPPIPFAPATPMAPEHPSIFPKAARCSNALPFATGARPNPSPLTRKPRRSGTSASARRACRRRTGGSSRSVISFSPAVSPSALVWQSARGSIVPWVVQIDKIRRSAGRRAGHRRLSANRSADRLASRALHRECPRHSCRSRSSSARTGSRPMTSSPTRARWPSTTTPAPMIPSPRSDKSRSPSTSRASFAPRTNSFRVAWTERRYENASLASTERWTAILTIVVQPPRDAERLRKNPLGLFIHAINWSKELGQ